MRPLQDHESDLIKALYEAAGIPFVSSIRVRATNEDGGSGLLIQPGSHIEKIAVSSRWFLDSDGIEVRASLNCTRQGKPAEIEFDKREGGNVQTWPQATALRERPLNKSRL